MSMQPYRRADCALPGQTSVTAANWTSNSQIRDSPSNVLPNNFPAKHPAKYPAQISELCLVNALVASEKPVNRWRQIKSICHHSQISQRTTNGEPAYLSGQAPLVRFAAARLCVCVCVWQAFAVLRAALKEQHWKNNGSSSEVLVKF